MSKSCINCEKRFAGCHSTCEDYKEYKAELEKRKKKYRAALEPTKYTIHEQAKRKSTQAEKKKNSRNRHYKR